MKVSGKQQLHLSGSRFTVDYSIHDLDEKSALERAREICVEETIEFPESLIPEGEIRDELIGKIENFTRINDKKFIASISYAIETSSFDLIQLLNVIYGNISMAPGIRVESFHLPDLLLASFKGPRFGMDGIRNMLGVYNRPVLCTAIKPMGLNAKEFARMAYELAIGGIEIIKDDHGLSNQSFSPFKERVDRVVEAVTRANKETGEKCMYWPNLTSPADEIVDRALYAKNAGAGGILLIGSLIGWDTMRMLAGNDKIGLPIMSHPSFHGIYFQCKNMGFSAQSMYGLIPRLAGADATIFPNYIGRFPSTLEDCQEILIAATSPMGKIKSSFPTPGGGLTLEKLPEFRQTYQNDIIYLMGGGLHHGESLVNTCRSFREIVGTKN